jgi:1-acyl-sn-glycerol-3-phosphate acyltransferase
MALKTITTMIASLILRMLGWKQQGQLPQKISSYVIIGAPHTSVFDVVIALLFRRALKLNARFFAKAELVTAWYGFIFKYLGAIPVKRTEKENNVAFACQLFKTNPNFILGMAPEGTRHFTPTWRTGFWFIAQNAQVPIVSIAIDFEHKLLKISEPFYTSNNLEKDMAQITQFFKGIKGFYPKLGTYS